MEGIGCLLLMQWRVTSTPLCTLGRTSDVGREGIWRGTGARKRPNSKWNWNLWHNWFLYRTAGYTLHTNTHTHATDNGRGSICNCFVVCDVCTHARVCFRAFCDYGTMLMMMSVSGWLSYGDRCRIAHSTAPGSIRRDDPAVSPAIIYTNEMGGMFFVSRVYRLADDCATDVLSTICLDMLHFT